ncbi:putative ternary complex factor MIP1, leucine-zipper [Helianthus annuus]|nr:putative ternary complex factor MIP1, leucine-zipper [Helianthus annuus]
MSLTQDVKLRKILPDQSSVWSESEMTPCSSLLSSIASNGTPNLKSSMELVKEITSLETEILHLERHILSLYRTAFQQRARTLHTKRSASEQKIESQSQPVADQSLLKKVNSDALLSGQHGQLSSDQIKSAISNSSSRKVSIEPIVRCFSFDHCTCIRIDLGYVESLTG